MRLAVLLCALVLGQAAHGQRTYAGDEAAALRCSNTMALTAIALNRADLIGDQQKDAMLGVTLLILERHVGGTWRQKKAALAVIRDRRSVPDTLDDYRRNAARCLQRFPIN